MQRPHGNRTGERERRATAAADVLDELRLKAAHEAANEKYFADLRDAQEKRKHRQSWTEDDKTAIVAEWRAGNDTAEAFVKRWMSAHPGRTLSLDTLKHWSCKYRENARSPAVVASRGRPLMLLPPEVRFVLDHVESYRAQFLPVSTGAVHALAVQAVDFYRPELRAANIAGKQLLMSPSWARRFLRQHAYRGRKRTGDRTVPMKAIVDAAPPFYGKIRALGAVTTNPRLWFNMDEFRVTLDEHANWTWTRTVDCNNQPAAKNVHIVGCKVAFTASILTNAAGEALLLQLIWAGKTNRVEVRGDVMRLLDQRIMQCESESHFQTAETFALWTQRVAGIVDNIRRECGTPDARAVLLLDHAPQHMREPLKTLADVSKIDSIFVPEKMTHVFQPADMFVICCFKKFVRAKWDRHLVDITGDINAECRQEAIRRFLHQSRPMARARKVAIMSAALQDLTAESIQLSWWMTGIVRELDECNLDWSRVHRHPISDRYATNCYIDVCRRSVEQRRTHIDVDDGSTDGSEHEEDPGFFVVDEAVVVDDTGAPATAVAFGLRGAAATIDDDDVSEAAKGRHARRRGTPQGAARSGCRCGRESAARAVACRAGAPGAATQARGLAQRATQPSRADRHTATAAAATRRKVRRRAPFDCASKRAHGTA